MLRTSVAAVAFLLAPMFAQAQVKMLRHPSYSGGKIAFSYLGDIWVANENGTGAQRLTDNTAREIYPRFSPDGKWIAFSSNRDGNYDVYLIPSAGGIPRQLTFHSADDNVVGWTPDNKRIVFSSSRGNGAFPSIATLWTISADGGIETPLDTDWGAWAGYSPDGRKLAFTRHPAPWSRKHYRGSYAADLWVEDIASKSFTRLGDPDYKGNLLWPMYAANGEIYFVSNETASEKNIQFGGPEVMKSVNNIWKISDRGGKPVQVTHHEDGNLFFPSISADGRTIVYEDNFGLWKLDVATGKSSEIRIDIKSDPKQNETELVTINNETEGFSLSPSNKRAAVVAHGEIFTIATDRGEPQRVTETPWREREPRWSPDGKWIAFVSDRTGREEIYISDELGKNTKKLSGADCDKNALIWSPDSKTLVWSGSDHKLRRVDPASGAETVIDSNVAGNIQNPQFSPDGKWLSYSKQDKLLRQHVWVKELATGQDHMIGGDEFLISNGAKWTPDGKRILFLGGVGAAGIAELNRPSSQLYSVALTPIEKDPSDRGIDTEAQAEAAQETAQGSGRGGRGGAPSNVQVKIVWDGFDRRITQLTRMPGAVSTVVPSPDSHTYLFSAAGGAAEQGPGPEAGGGPAYYTINEDGTGLTRLNTSTGDGGRGRGGRGGGGGGFGGNEPQWARDSRSIYYLAGGGLYTLPISPASTDTPAAGAGRSGRGGRGGGAAETASAATGSSPRRITFALRMEIDVPAERRQVFDEAWRTMKNRFYDPKMHGANWAAAKDTYESLLPYIDDTEELHNLIMEMIGDMNASHTGISGGTRVPGEAREERIQTRYPGFDLAPDSSGYYKVAYIYHKGPADHDYIKLAPGNFVLAVNDKDLKTTDNYWKLFNVLPGRKFEFLVNASASTTGAWTVSIDPMTRQAFADLQYARWVEDHKQMVAKLSGGDIGYLHIRAMDAPSLAKFQNDLIENQDKKALIIDERFNGGGGIDQELLEILNQRKAYQHTRSRDSLDVSRPGQAFFGPMVVLQNERSASDAEMFPDGFRALGLGKLVGVPTSGQVIGTGSYTLLDGSALRTPGSGVFTSKGQNMENYGVPPDVYVDNTPSDFLAGHDRQIEKAIEVLRSEINGAK